MRALPGPTSAGGGGVSAVITFVLIMCVFCAGPLWVVGRMEGYFGPPFSAPEGYATTSQNGTDQNPITMVQPNGYDTNDDLVRSLTNKNQADAFKTIEEGYAVKRLSEAESCDIRNDCNLYWQRSQPQQGSSLSSNVITLLIGILIGGALLLRVLTGGR